MIWETLLGTTAADETNDTVFLVTRDLGFLTKDGGNEKLHPDLLQDLDARGIDEDRVVVIDNPSNVVEAVNTAVAEAQAEAAEARAAAAPPDEAEHQLATLLRGYAIDAAHRAELLRVSLAALESLVGREVTETLGYGGDYQRPDFVRFDVRRPWKAR